MHMCMPHLLCLQHTVAKPDEVQLGHPVVVHRSSQQVDGVQKLGQQLVVRNGRFLGQVAVVAGVSSEMHAGC